MKTYVPPFRKYVNEFCILVNEQSYRDTDPGLITSLHISDFFLLNSIFHQLRVTD